MDVEKQIAIIFAASKGQLDDLDIEEISNFETGLFEYLDLNASDSLEYELSKFQLIVFFREIY